MRARGQRVARVCGDEVESNMIVVYVECRVEVLNEITGRVEGDKGKSFPWTPPMAKMM